MKTPFETQKAKINYLKGLIRVAKCDQVIDDTEKGYISLAAKGMMLSDDERYQIDLLWESDNTIDVEFDSKYDSAFFLQEAVQVAMVDGFYDPVEQIELRKLANELGIDHKDLSRIESWVQEGIEWRSKGEKIIDDISGEG